MHLKKTILASSLASLLSSPTMAIVNMEDLHTGKPRDGFSGNVLLSLTSSSGNVDKEDYSVGSRLQWHREPRTQFLIFNASYGKVDGVKNTQKTFLHLRHIEHLRERLAAEAYLQQDTNEFARLDYRRLYGGGLRLTLLEEEQQGNIYLGLGAYHAQEKISGDPPDAGKYSEWRASSYLILTYQASANTVLASTTYYQPKFGATSDYRALQQAAARVRISDRLALVVSADYSFNSRPPEGVSKRETTYRTSLSVDF